MAPWLALSAVALRGAEVEAALERARAAAPGGGHFGRFRLEVLVLSLWAGDAPAFGSVEEAGALLTGDADALCAEVFDALAVVSPTYARSDVSAWERVLHTGAADPTNVFEALLLGGCIEHGWGGLTPRPDLYFGCPLAALTDGQLMAYRAARAVVSDLTSSAGKGAAPPPFT